MADRALRAGARAFVAKEAAPEIKGEAALIDARRVGRASLDARAAIIGAPRWIKHWEAAKPIRHGRDSVRERRRSVALFQASEE